MKPGAFGYRRAESAEDAVRLFLEVGEGAQYLAGGQSLMATLNFRVSEAGTLIDLTRIESLKGIEQRGNAIHIGALTTHASVARSSLVRKRLPLIAEAYVHVAHPAIRNRGTIGGSIALGDPASEMPACMLALDAVIHANGPAGKRSIPIDDFYLGLYETALEEGELLTGIEIPLPAEGARHGFEEIARRHGDYAMAGLAVMTTGRRARMAYFAISDRALRSTAAEDAFVSGASPAECAEVATREMYVFGDLNASENMKRHLAGVLMRRVLLSLDGGASA
ncbi:xanthine dehydrogenase family protein subunit M [Aquamicrobium sp. LC103]|uniref:FAD binding domain-containing protein n=1 Tax=Aquamicrobium sp. LC103 TaxID=1120658 RepID=UPI00063EB4EF|nr:xanthine dehydrogenase family protein subunit M [Aquamicrobium sp. LC103]TKT69235.1 xanthine dehydrogenase family protein subunit M [Aquamicrobium sp. LC103]